jgi:hypothetical protein
MMLSRLSLSLSHKHTHRGKNNSLGEREESSFSLCLLLLLYNNEKTQPVFLYTKQKKKPRVSIWFLILLRHPQPTPLRPIWKRVCYSTQEQNWWSLLSLCANALYNTEHRTSLVDDEGRNGVCVWWWAATFFSPFCVCVCVIAKGSNLRSSPS